MNIILIAVGLCCSYLLSFNAYYFDNVTEFGDVNRLVVYALYALIMLSMGVMIIALQVCIINRHIMFNTPPVNHSALHTCKC